MSYNVIFPVVFLVIISCVGEWRTRAENVFASSEHIKRLVTGEQHLIKAINRYILSERDRLKKIESTPKNGDTRSLSDDDEPLTDDVMLIAGNPLETFRMINRFTTTWSTINNLISDEKSREEFTSSQEPLQDYIPHSNDLIGAYLALGRLQDTYQLPLKEFVNGSINGRVMSTPLSQHIVLQVGSALLKMFAEERPYDNIWHAAVSWINHSLVHKVQPLSTPQEIYHALGQAYAMRGDYLMALDYTRKAIELDPPKATTYLANIQNSYVTIAIDPDWSSYQSLCSHGAYHHHVLKNPSRLQCMYKISKQVPIRRHKMEYLHISPDIVLFHDVISDQEILILQKLADTEMKTALVGHFSYVVSSIRVGKTGWLTDNKDKFVKTLSRRIADATGLDVLYKSTEPLQMSNYGIGGYYTPHHDYIEERFSDPVSFNEMYGDIGDRIATFMLYLSDVELGGATAFPRLGIAAKPVKNAGLFWYNYKRSGQFQEDSLHAGCPVLLGEKWVANKWIREIGQEFVRPCAIYPDI